MPRPAQAPRPWRPSGVVSLLSDYGLDDPCVGIVKGVLWRDAPRLRAIVDLTRAIPPGDVAAAAFLLERSWSTFPAGSVHLAIVDPGVGSERAPLLAEARGHVFLAPDNGLLAPLIASEPLVVVRKVGSSAPVRGPSTTFDGRDRFAPLVARLVEGDPPAAFGEASTDAHRGLDTPVPRRLADGSIAAEVVHVDRFGNLVTNLPFIWLAEAGANWRERWGCTAAGRSFALVRTYGEARGRDPVARANSYDRMEIALARGSAAGALGLARGAEVRFVTGAQASPARAARAARADEHPRPEKRVPAQKSALAGARKARRRGRRA
jgi:hypothetical protein